MTEQVLIDTWWNVNMTAIIVFKTLELVLIDTWWNVNSIKSSLLSIDSGFNRYMVECKYKCCIWDQLILRRFNRYMVECKWICEESRIRRNTVLIDTWWNVNLFNPRTWSGVACGFNRYMVECKCNSFHVTHSTFKF